MARVHRVPRLVGFALLILYAVLLPLLVMQTTSAHKLIQGGIWRHSVKHRQLDYFDRTDYDSQVHIARNEWRAISTIRIKEVDDKDDAEIRVSDANSCNLFWIGQYDPPTDRVRFNKCAMNWAGGDYPGTQSVVESGSTTASRKARTAVHEFGHALGLDHNPLGECNSVMYDNVRYDETTCYIPEDHDRSDIDAYWP